ncbi:MAG: alcohol dehydrogenase catalytic domain-containing protein [Armatimonadota bacterium]|nr:alcohol dehydrogenase catalytic domain-containing protein [Armatimonadota bacterium]MDR7463171.1 alcohol dehydrogenase catalytic domain-containing protein [Armatimonadota bacterium]MDR7468842.1 alcohol dehydrogenase catalytic domain-containing protein [Armatimonadota bacterium]MDR7475416.1 alcohol dehydrogenase catalytic domain-containing protein [Armatimonadota bacterium]MDR7540181.1 alcohol dehydrogenase catalytic domain-containing protein [Armatimonadota bacterium]
MPTMRAARLFATRDMRVVEVERPRPGRGEVVVRIAYTGICGTDIEIYTGRMPFIALGLIPLPQTLGHEWSGIVQEVGEGVTEFAPGDRVTGDVTISCRVCEFCKAGRYNICPNRRSVGVIRKDGALAEYLVMPAHHVYRIPDGLSLEEAALAEPASCAVHAVRRLGVQPGDRIVVVGDGTLGLLALQAARAAGAGRVVMIGSHDEKLALAQELGAHATVNRHRQDVVQAPLDLCGGKVEGVIEASGNTAAVAPALRLLRPGGRMVVISIYHEPVPALDLAAVTSNEITITGTLAGPNIFPGLLRLMAEGAIRTRPLITHRLPLDEVPEAFKRIEMRSEPYVKMLVFQRGTPTGS